MCCSSASSPVAGCRSTDPRVAGCRGGGARARCCRGGRGEGRSPAEWLRARRRANRLARGNHPRHEPAWGRGPRRHSASPKRRGPEALQERLAASPVSAPRQSARCERASAARNPLLASSLWPAPDAMRRARAQSFPPTRTPAHPSARDRGSQRQSHRRGRPTRPPQRWPDDVPSSSRWRRRAPGRSRRSPR